MRKSLEAPLAYLEVQKPRDSWHKRDCGVREIRHGLRQREKVARSFYYLPPTVE
jgi:hypothetical protein